MIRRIERTWFEIWGTEEAQNRMLKGLLAFMVALFAVETIAIVCLAVRRPLVVAVSSETTKLLTSMPLQSEFLQNEVRRIITGYLNLSHTWDWQNIDNNMRMAEKLVGKNYSRKYVQATSDQIKLAKDKHLSQRFHILSLDIDEKIHVARVTADRVLVIDSLRAVNPVTLEIGYNVDSRTADNPEGVYIISEAALTK